jgi:hypothetical protein
VSFKLPERFNRVNLTDQEKAPLLEFLETLPQGVNGRPRRWSMGDGSWDQQGGRCD